MDFFNACKTKTEAKALFRKLSKCFHPDKGGPEDMMIELKKQFDNFGFKENTTFSSKSPGSQSHIWNHPFPGFHGRGSKEYEDLRLRITLLNSEIQRKNALIMEKERIIDAFQTSKDLKDYVHLKLNFQKVEAERDKFERLYQKYHREADDTLFNLRSTLNQVDGLKSENAHLKQQISALIKESELSELNKQLLTPKEPAEGLVSRVMKWVNRNG